MPQDWADLNQNMFSALWLEKMAISIAIGLIVMVAALNIIASLILLVMEKSRDIAILKTMGTSAASVPPDFHASGARSLVCSERWPGPLAGCALIYMLDRYKLIQIPIDVYQISYVPFTLLPLRLYRRRHRRRADLLRRDDLSVVACGRLDPARRAQVSDSEGHSSKSAICTRATSSAASDCRCSAGSTCRSSGARWWRSWARPASGRAPCSTSLAGWTRATRDLCGSATPIWRR